MRANPIGEAVDAAISSGRPLEGTLLRGATRGQLLAALRRFGVTADPESGGDDLRRLLRLEQRRPKEAEPPKAEPKAVEPPKEEPTGKALSPIRASAKKAVKAAKRKAGASRSKGSK